MGRDCVQCEVGLFLRVHLAQQSEREAFLGSEKGKLAGLMGG